MFRWPVLVLATMAGGCASIEEAQRQSDAEASLVSVAQAEFDVRWATHGIDYAIDRYAKFAPAVESGFVVAANRQGVVERRKAETGELVWTQDFNASFTAGPTIAGNHVFVGSANAELFMLDKESGRKIWQKPLSSEILSPAQVAQGVVIAQTNDGKIVALREGDGELLWTFERSVPILTIRGTSVPVVSADKVIAAFANGKVVALNLFDGKLLWETAIAVPKGRSELERIVDIDGELVVADGVVYAITFQGKLAAISLDGGRILWSRDMSSFLGLAFDQSYLYVTDDHGKLWAFDRNSGSSLWMQDRLKNRALTPPVLDGEKLIVGDVTGRVVWFNKSDGRILHRIDYLRVADQSGVNNPAAAVSPIGAYELMKAKEDRSVVKVTPVVESGNLLVTYRNGVMTMLRPKTVAP